MSIHTALSGAVAAEERVNTVANNLANVNTHGFKKDRLTFREYLTELEKEDETEVMPRARYTWEDYDRLRGIDKSYVAVDGTEIDFSKGRVVRTGKPLNFMIHGKGFFVVQTPTGLSYTRNGSFQLSKDGTLVTSDGYPVLQGEAPLLKPTDGAPIVLTGRNLSVDREGNIREGESVKGRLAVVTFESLRGLQKVGHSLFVNKNPTVNPQKAANVEIQNGELESSNVNLIEEMVSMIKASRAFESYKNVINSFNEVNGKSINEIGKLD